jgi:hypothetical protein
MELPRVKAEDADDLVFSDEGDSQIGDKSLFTEK